MRLNEYANEDQLRTTLIERNLREITLQLDELRKIVAELVGARADIVPPDDAVVTVSPDNVAPFAMGFYAREYGNGRPYRWTGDGNVFELRIHLNRCCDWRFTMHADPANGVDLQATKAFVDYAEIPLEVVAGANLISGTVPRKLFASQLVLSFYHPQSVVPNHFDSSSPDARSLCMAFYEMRLTPHIVPEHAQNSSTDTLSTDALPIEASPIVAEEAAPKSRRRRNSVAK